MTVDVHGHISPAWMAERHPMPPALCDVEGMIEAKLAAGVRMTLVGSPVGAGAMVPSVGLDNYDQPEGDLERLHDWFATTVGAHRDHLRAYVYVDPFGGPGHLAAAAARVRHREFVGLIVNSSVRGRYLDHPGAAEFFAMAEEAEVPVLVHAPAVPAAGQGLTDPRLVERVGRYCDVAVGTAVIAHAGILDRHPRLRLIAAAGGGALALIAARLDAADAVAGRRTGPEESPSWQGSALRRVFVDTASPGAASLHAALAYFGPDRVLYGTDSPPLGDAAVTGPLEAVAAELPDGRQRHAVTEGNALRLFPALVEPNPISVPGRTS